MKNEAEQNANNPCGYLVNGSNIYKIRLVKIVPVDFHFLYQYLNMLRKLLYIYLVSERGHVDMDIWTLHWWQHR